VNIGYFAYSGDLRPFLLSHPGSLHCRNVAANPSMAVAVFPSPQSWTNPGRRVQLFGTCRVAFDDVPATPKTSSVLHLTTAEVQQPLLECS
jgi:hypothetical protein